MKLYKIVCRETGDIIESGLILVKAKKLVEKFEADDIENDVYTPNFYQII